MKAHSAVYKMHLENETGIKLFSTFQQVMTTQLTGPTVDIIPSEILNSWNNSAAFCRVENTLCNLIPPGIKVSNY